VIGEIRSYFELLREDPWRRAIGFSPGVAQVLEATQNPSAADEEIIQSLDAWIAKYQPCLFGRVAAKKGLLHYCILRESELLSSDEAVRRKVQSARLSWKRRALVGEASGFIIAVISPRLALAVPDSSVQAIAKRLASLYLLEEVDVDRIFTDRVHLEVPDRNRTTWEWLVGANYFSAQGDQRWWQDHRFPSGMALSMNSVGHMVKAGRLSIAIHDFEEAMGTDGNESPSPKLESLEKALEFAMRTISLASQGPSGQATALLGLQLDSSSYPRCPVSLPPDLAGKSHCEYTGQYHTDTTLPSEYFTADVSRPEGLSAHKLDFTYLFDESLDNPDFSRMGQGVQIREADTPEQAAAAAYRFEKRFRGRGTELGPDEASVLRETLRSD
jgi:hypothetical protein